MSSGNKGAWVVTSAFVGGVALAALGSAQPAALAARGDLLATYNFEATRFAQHPTQPLLYASLRRDNSVAVINTETLALVANVPVGASPYGLTLSPDGSRLYIATSGVNSLAVMDTATRTMLPSLALNQRPLDVEVGLGNRLFVLGGENIMQIDATTGAPAGPNLGAYVYSGELEISPDRRTLFYGDYGLSPSSLYKFDVSGTDAPLLWESGHGDSGSNGQDVTISHNGRFIAYPNGSGQGGYKIARYRTSDMEIEGYYDTGAYPRHIAFSPDDLYAYTAHTGGLVDVFDANTFAEEAPIRVSGGYFNEPSELIVDASGRHLFAAFPLEYDNSRPATLKVYDTGRVAVPEPWTGATFLLPAALVALRRERRVGPRP